MIGFRMKIGITGHQQLGNENDWVWVEKSMRALLSNMRSDLIGISSLASGADQLFARIILDLSGILYAVIPFHNYERAFRSTDDAESYHRLLALAERKETLHTSETDEKAFFLAGQRIVGLADKMVAVWDGKPAGGLGGTADVVEYARKKQVGVIQLNPLNREVKDG
jgi:hypothetical protein